MKKFLLILGLMLFYPTILAANLSISTFHVLFDANSPKRAEVVRVTNTGNTPKTYRIKLVNFKQTAEGKYLPLEAALPGNPFASPYISFSPHEATLQPGQSQTVRLVRKAMAAAPDGEYVSHLLVQEMPSQKSEAKAATSNELKFDIKALYGITIPIMIDKGELQSSATIGKAGVVNNAKAPYAEVTVKRSGNRAFWGTLIVKENNKEIGRVNAFKIFMTTSERQLKIPLSKKTSGKVSIILQDARSNAVLATKNI